MIRRVFFCGCVPSMGIDLEVKVLWGVDRNDPSEPHPGKYENARGTSTVNVAIGKSEAAGQSFRSRKRSTNTLLDSVFY